jgi:hypothetical protein
MAKMEVLHLTPTERGELEGYLRKRKCPDGYERHHLLPQQQDLQAWFQSKGLDINAPQFLVCLEKGIHRLKVFNGIHTIAEWRLECPMGVFHGYHTGRHGPRNS